MGTFVTLAEVLEARGSPLEEDEVWCLLLGTVEALLDISCKGPGNMCSVLSPGSVLLSANGGFAFKSNARSEDLVSFTAPEVQQGQAASSKTATEKMVVYSLGMTLFWSVDYHVPQNQPVQLSEHLNSLLLSMCEDVDHRRADLLTVLETSELHHKASLLPPPERLIKQLVEDVYRDSVDHVSMTENGAELTDRSQMVRERLHGSFSQNWSARHKFSGTFSGSPFQTDPLRTPQNMRHRDSYCSVQSRSPYSPYLDSHRHSITRPITSFESSNSLSERRLQDMGPEFIRMLEEPLLVLELPMSIVSKKGKTASSQRGLSVIMPNGQSIVVKCDVKSTGGDVFDMIVAHSNLVEHFYFGLAYIDDNEFFFLDNDTRISKVAPDSWKKVPTSTFVLFFRVKFFVKDISLLSHKLTCHQYYLQLRKDLLEDRLACHEETGLYLGGLALQAEYGECRPEVYGRNYYRPDQYVAKSIMEKRALPFLRDELIRLHNNNGQMLPDESELEFLRVAQQLPEYGVLFYNVAREKKPVVGELVIGVCAKGVMVYEVKEGLRSTSQTFYWRETSSISSSRRKFVIESRGSKKKHMFVTERSKIAKYLCNLCSAQHKFNNEMHSRQLSHSLASEESIVQYAAVCRAQNSQRRSVSISEAPLNDSPRQPTPKNNSMTKLCDHIASRIEARLKKEKELYEQSGGCQLEGQNSTACSPRSSSVALSSSSALRDNPTKSAIAEREVISVSLKKDPKLGLGIVIVGEETVGRYDLGIFVASIVPGGPADKEGRIRPGGRLISLNQTSLEGMTFSEAAKIMQNSPQEVQLIASQPKVALTPNSVRSPQMKNYKSQTTLTADGRSGEDDLDEIVSIMMTPKTGSRLHVPDVRILNAQDMCSRSSLSLNCVRPEEIITVELKKKTGSLGISIAGGVNTGLRNGGIYIKSLVPGGAAERDGRIQTGDRVLVVDGINFKGFTHEQAVECLAKTGEVVTLVVEREVMTLPRVSLSPDTDSISCHSASPEVSQMRNNSCPAIITTPYTLSNRLKDYYFVSDDNTLEVTLRKSLNSLGFSFLLCELDPSGGLGSLVRIKQLFPGQPAQQSGSIKEGDVILAVNGEPLKGLSYQRVLQLLRGSPPEVRLALCRPSPGILPHIDTLTGT
ncbi:tyrosine-protein phosphatase non-receptor type 13 isoform X2 [Osmerus eperlanus]|uniref:tyrosine-protein phosphatase non-receptor type 13 isoform X2 n=1 Tax=Osmerus eperlanus TaxID=29151 RepID=UPI002E138CC1